MKQEKTRAIYFDFIGGKDVMPIGGFYGPFTHGKEDEENTKIPDYITDECFQLIAEAGINLITATADQYDVLPERVTKSLELGEKYGIGLMINDGNVLKGVGDDTFTAEQAQEAISKYSQHASFCGVHLVDEPSAPYYCAGDGTRDISRYVHIAKVLQEDLGYICYMNMYPTLYGEEKERNYKIYVDEFCETLKPKVIIWDYYPFDKSRDENYPMYFWNMDLMRQYSEKNNVPFWVSIQAGSQWAEGGLVDFDSEQPYYPNESQFNWNVNTCLAFGAQGLQYFPLMQPYFFAYGKSTEWDFERNGIL